MEQKKYFNLAGQEKTVYELSNIEFNAVIKNLRLFGNLAKAAITLSNDRKSGMRPRLAPVKEEIELLHEVLGDENADNAQIGMTDLDVLRSDRAEIAQALRKPTLSNLHKRVGHVVVGLPTIASAFNDLRGPLMNNEAALVDAPLLRSMMDQFYDEAAQRVMDNAQNIA